MPVQFERRLSYLEKLKRQYKSATPLEKDILSFASGIVKAQHGKNADLDEWQRDFLTSPAKRIILNTCRQSGKSTVVAIAAIHFASTTPRSLTLVLSPTLRQSSLLFRKIADYYTLSGRSVRAVRETTYELRLANGATLIALPGSNEASIRGFSSVDLLLIDEAARVSYELIYAVMPMLAVSKTGRFVLLSTPYGFGNYYADVYNAKDGPFKKIHITADDCPRIPRDFVDEQRATMTPDAFKQEFYGLFNQFETGVFTEDSINGMFDGDVNEFSF